MTMQEKLEKKLVQGEGGYSVSFHFAGGTYKEVWFDRKGQAVAIMDSYKRHCRGEAV